MLRIELTKRYLPDNQGQLKLKLLMKALLSISSPVMPDKQFQTLCYGKTVESVKAGPLYTHYTQNCKKNSIYLLLIYKIVAFVKKKL